MNSQGPFATKLKSWNSARILSYNADCDAGTDGIFSHSRLFLSWRHSILSGPR